MLKKGLACVTSLATSWDCPPKKRLVQRTDLSSSSYCLITVCTHMKSFNKYLILVPAKYEFSLNIKDKVHTRLQGQYKSQHVKKDVTPVPALMFKSREICTHPILVWTCFKVPQIGSILY